ncbi:MAG TPA: hypothetical protein VII06_22175 [Chloroflexota bacterium]|jgi:hypothetical protein
METPRRSRGRQLIDACVEAKGLRPGEYAYFFGTGEGTFLPISEPGDEVEESSGYVLDRQGTVYFFWFGWDEATGTPALLEWEQQEPDPTWAEDDEYRRARERLGLVAA